MVIVNKIITMDIILRHYGNMECRVFKQGSGGLQNWKDFCQKINITKGNYKILRIGETAKFQKVSKFDFQSQYFYVKNIRNLFDFFSLKNMNLGAQFFFIDIFS